MGRHVFATILLISLQLAALFSLAQKKDRYDAIYSGTPWFDQNGKIVSAHGANIIRLNKKFYLFGEIHTDTSNAFAGFSCYSSTDLYNWGFENIALPVQSTGKLGPNRVGERPKVLKCPKTGQYVMFMHVDTIGYKDQFVGYAISKEVTGPYSFRGPLLFNGKPIKKWDMGVYQDSDGAGYILTHGGQIHRLADDYTSIVELESDAFTTAFESPTMLKSNGIYFFIGSHLTSWEKKDNYYYTSSSLKGPWISRGQIAPPGTLTWNSQSTYVLAVEGKKDTTFMFMGDRWSFPKQASSATYVWQPLKINGTSLSLPAYLESWKINTSAGTNTPKLPTGRQTVENNDKRLKFTGKWTHVNSGDLFTESRSEEKGASVSYEFTGRKVTVYSNVQSGNGYALVQLVDMNSGVPYSATTDMYSKSKISTPVFISPEMPKGRYRLVISVTGTRPNWSDKRRSDYGSTSHAVSFDKLVVE